MSVNSPSSSKSSIPLGLVGFIAIASGILFIGALIWQTRTSEAQAGLYLPSNMTGIGGVFNQWTAFAQGNMSTTEQAAFLYAWGLETFVLIGATAFTLVAATIGRGHPLIVRLFGIMLIVCFLLDWGSDWRYLSASSGFWTCAIVSLMIAAAVTFLGPVCFACIEHLYHHW